MISLIDIGKDIEPVNNRSTVVRRTEIEKGCVGDDRVVRHDHWDLNVSSIQYEIDRRATEVKASG